MHRYWDNLTPEQQESLKIEFPLLALPNGTNKVALTVPDGSCMLCGPSPSQKGQLWVPWWNIKADTVPVCLDRIACHQRERVIKAKQKEEAQKTAAELATKLVPLPTMVAKTAAEARKKEREESCY